MIAFATIPDSLTIPRPASGRAPDARSTGQWPELLWNLACLDQVWLETSTTGIALGHRAPLQGVRIHEEIGLATGRRFDLCLFLNRWHALSVSTQNGARRRLSIEDRDRTPLITLSVDTKDSVFALRTLLPSYPAVGQGVIPPPHRTDCPSLTDETDFTQAVAECWSGRDDAPKFGDIAEVCGRLPLDPARLRGRGRLEPVDHELIPCFLDAMIDQVLPMRILMGTDGVAHRFDGAFHARQRRPGPWIRLLGDEVRLSIDASAIDSAWVFQEHGAGRRQLRFYDASGRALAVIDDSPGLDPTETPIWRTLVNALLD